MCSYVAWFSSFLLGEIIDFFFLVTSEEGKNKWIRILDFAWNIGTDFFPQIFFLLKWIIWKFEGDRMLVWFERAVVQLVLCSALMVNHGVCEILNNDPLNKKEKKRHLCKWWCIIFYILIFIKKNLYSY